MYRGENVLDKIFLLFCNFLSSFIVITLLFQFMNSNYERNYKKKSVYYISFSISVLTLTLVNMLNISVLNLLAWMMITGICAYFFYYDDNYKAGKRIIECEAVAVYISACETLGAILLQWIMQLLGMDMGNTIIWYCLGATFSQVILIFLYYFGMACLTRKRRPTISKDQYSVYVIMFLYSLVNLLLIAGEFMQRKTEYLWLANMGCIVLADLYLMYYVKMSGDKNFYEKQVEALEQQAKMQYEYYLLQSEKYNNTLQVLHDVNKHIKTIEDLFITEHSEIATEYAKEITGMLSTLIPTKYTENPILDILLSDKAKSMKAKGIDFRVDIDNVDMSSIEPIDVTTIFGNLLDNAIEASEKSKKRKYVYVKIGGYHQMISVRVENSSDYVKWKDGMPISEKGENRGLGLLNVRRSITKYDGNIKLIWEDNKFIVELFLNI